MLAETIVQDWAGIMQIWKADAKTRRVGILLFDDFSNHCLANAVEPLRAANTFAQRQLYSWTFLSIDGAPVVSSSGLPVAPQSALARVAGDDLFVMPSYGFRDHAGRGTIRALRAAAHRWDRIAGLDTGAWLLAAAGLLDGRRATIHWDELAAMAQAFPQVEVVPDRFVIDGNRLSCGGVTTTFELVLHLIRQTHGPMLAVEVAALFMLGETGPAGLRELNRTSDGMIHAAAAIMRRNIENPQPLPAIAARLGLGRKRMEQLFRAELGMTAQALYRAIRLHEARRLIRQAPRPVSEIAALCGYADASALTRAFRAEFGMTPTACRAGRASPGT